MNSRDLAKYLGITESVLEGVFENIPELFREEPPFVMGLDYENISLEQIDICFRTQRERIEHLSTCVPFFFGLYEMFQDRMKNAAEEICGLEEFANACDEDKREHEEMTEEVEYLCEERFRQIKQLENFIRLCESMSELQTAREAYEKGSGLGLIKYLDKKYPGIHTFGEEQKEKENG